MYRDLGFTVWDLGFGLSGFRGGGVLNGLFKRVRYYS